MQRLGYMLHKTNNILANFRFTKFYFEKFIFSKFNFVLILIKLIIVLLLIYYRFAKQTISHFLYEKS